MVSSSVIMISDELFANLNFNWYKLGGEYYINEGAANLLKLAVSIDTDKMPSPTFMAVIIGVGKYAYRREDGVYVIPIGCLKD